MSSNQQNLTIGSIGLKSDYRVVKISLTTGLGSYPGTSVAGRAALDRMGGEASSRRSSAQTVSGYNAALTPKPRFRHFWMNSRRVAHVISLTLSEILLHNMILIKKY